MKRLLYDITDEEFATLLGRTHASFVGARIPYMFVGGVAVQGYNAKYLTNLRGKSLKELREDPAFRVQDYFRATDDVDITLKKEGEDVDFGRKVLLALANIAKGTDFFSLSGLHIITILQNRTGVSRPTFYLGKDVPSGERPNPDKEVSFNIYRGPRQMSDPAVTEFENMHYDEFLERAVKLELPYSSDSKLVLMVKNPEDLLATKIIRGRDKDWTDILSLVRNSKASGSPIDLDVVKNLLCAPHPRYQIPDQALVERYERFISFIEANK